MEKQMNRSAYIEQAIVETLAVHPNNAYTLVNTLFSNCCQVDPLSITRTNNARESIRNTDSRDFIKYILSSVVNLYYAMIYDWNTDRSLNSLRDEEKNKAFYDVYPWYSDCAKAMDVIRTQSDPVTYYQIYANELFGLVSAVVNSRFNSLWYQMNVADPRGIGKKTRQDIDTKASYYPDSVELIDKIEQDRIVAKNVQFYGKTANKCLFDVLSGKQLFNKRNEYALDGKLFASQDIGNKRDNQEDSLIILTHPKNPEFKLLAVADGMGGADAGEMASSMTIKKISEWFMNLPLNLYYNKDLLQKEFQNVIYETSKMVSNYNRENRIKSGCTFTGAIVGDKSTVIGHVGDSRAYTIDKHNIKLQTTDQSAVWPQYKKPDGTIALYKPSQVPSYYINDLRFQHNSNAICNFIGSDRLGPGSDFTKVNMITIENKDYEQLLIMSDGVSDLISSDGIFMISKTTPAGALTKVLVDSALANDARRLYSPDDNHDQVIGAGKDNASVVAYIR